MMVLRGGGSARVLSQEAEQLVLARQRLEALRVAQAGERAQELDHIDTVAAARLQRAGQEGGAGGRQEYCQDGGDARPSSRALHPPSAPNLRRQPRHKGVIVPAAEGSIRLFLLLTHAGRCCDWPVCRCLRLSAARGKAP
jgi:hypothetical protein